jgi:CoA:oxalate CoA-transferase
MKFLDGVRVLDLTNVLAGPFCCHQLAHLGAEVIKIEIPGRGDLARQLGADEELNDRLMGVSFLAQNAGKKSVTLNLKTDRGKALLRRLVGTADVLVENFRPGVMDRLGLGYESLRRDNPRLVYCAISGFGQDGPMSDLPAYDQIIQGVAGVMAITGDRDTAPMRVGYPVCDTIGGLTAAFAIAAALNAGGDARGAYIDVAMLEATLATMGWVVSNWLIAGVAPAPQGNENPTAAPSGTFAAKDGPINIAANKQAQWESLCRVLGRPDLATHPDYRRREGRKANRLALKAELEAALAHKPAQAWVDALTERGVPAGRVFTVPEILAHPQTAARDMLAGFTGITADGRPLRVLRTGFKVDGARPAVATPPPELGADNHAVWHALGLSETEIEQLIAEGVL